MGIGPTIDAIDAFNAFATSMFTKDGKYDNAYDSYISQWRDNLVQKVHNFKTNAAALP